MERQEKLQHILYLTSGISTLTRDDDPNLRQCVQVASLSDNNKSVIDPILSGITMYSHRYEE